MVWNNWTLFCFFIALLLLFSKIAVSFKVYRADSNQELQLIDHSSI